MLSQEEDRPPPGEKIKKLLANGEEKAARELRLQVLWTRQLGEELAAMGAPVVKTIDDCLDPERAYELLPRDEPCARTVPDSLLKAISWMEKVAEFRVELRATGGRLAWAAKDKIVEVLYEGAPLIRRAPRYPVMVLVAIERVVIDENDRRACESMPGPSCLRQGGRTSKPSALES